MTTIINADGKIMGRLASKIASKARDGETVRVVNSEKAVLSGDEEEIKQEYKKRYDRGARHDGPHFPKSPERILKRSVRGMLPYKSKEGREALKRVRTYLGVPEKFKDHEELENVKSGDELKNRNYVKLGEVSRHIGWTSNE